MEVIDLRSREVFSHEGRGVASLVDEPHLKISQVALEPGREIPAQKTGAPVNLQVIRGEGVFSSGKQSVQMGPGKLLRIAQGASMGVRNESATLLVFLMIETPLAAGSDGESLMAGKPGTFVNWIEFAPLKPGRDASFREWFHRSSEMLAKHPGFVSRTLLGPIEGGSRYAAMVEHESNETFMDMQLSDDRETIFHEAESFVLGPSTPHFYELILSYRK